MPRVRCRYYDENGSAIDGGCRTNSCQFVHPGDPDWDRAPRPRNPRQGGDVGRKPSTSWGMPPPAPPNRTSSSKESSRSTADFSRRKSDNGWGNSKNWGGSKPSDGRNTTMNRKTSLEKGGWGDNIADDGSTSWSAGSNKPAWGESSKEGTASNKGVDGDIAAIWGSSNNSSSSSWGEGSSRVSGWGEGLIPETGGWGGSNSVPAWEKERSSDPVESVVSAGPFWGTGDTSENSWGNRNQAGDSMSKVNTEDHSRDTFSSAWSSNQDHKAPGSTVDTKSRDYGWGGVSASSGEAFATQRGINDNPRESQSGSGKDNLSLGASVRNSSTAHVASSSTVVGGTKVSTISNKKSTALSGTKSTSGRKGKHQSKRQSMSKQLLKRARGPKARARLFAVIVKSALNTVRLQVDLQRAEENIVQWKQTRSSRGYYHSTPATRVILDCKRQVYGKKAVDIGARRDRSARALCALPDIRKVSSRYRNVAATKHRIMTYTTELSNWVTELQLHRRISSISKEKPPCEMDSQVVVCEQSTPHSEPDIPSAITSQEVPTGTDLKGRGTWNWTEIRQAISALETKIQSTSEEVYTKSFTKFSEAEDAQQKVTDLAKKALNDVKQRRADMIDKDQVARVAALRTRGRSIAETVAGKASVATKLLDVIVKNRARLDRIKAENVAAQDLCSELEDKIREVEKLEEEDRNEVTELTEQIQNLHTHKRKARTPRHVKMEDIIPRVQSMVEAQLEREVVPILDMFRRQCQIHNEGLEADVSKRLEPILRMTNAILQKAQGEAVTTNV